MSWKFWQKGESSTEGGALPKPKDLPEKVGRYLVVDQKMEPDWVWSLKAVLRPRAGSRDIQDLRIFSPDKADAGNVAVRNFNTLDAHPHLILFEGWINTRTNQLELIGKSTEKAA